MMNLEGLKGLKTKKRIINKSNKILIYDKKDKWSEWRSDQRKCKL